MVAPISSQRFKQITQNGFLAEEYSVALGINYLVVDAPGLTVDFAPLFWPNCVVIGYGNPTARPHDTPCQGVDVIATQPAQLDELITAIDAHPTAAATLMHVLRHNQHSSVEQGLLVESLAYSMLQRSTEFQAWLVTQPAPAQTSAAPEPLSINRTQDSHQTTLTLTFNRPTVHNAYNSLLKDALCEALAMAHADPAITAVKLDGQGPSFCAGGDLTEFGAVEDVGLAHLSRSTRSAAKYLATLTDSATTTTHAHLHGACIGAGIELPAFTQNITAHPDAFFQLPEVAMGLIPGAGGTVSVLKRIGRQRTAWLALSNQRLDAQTALAWGLIDQLSQ